MEEYPIRGELGRCLRRRRYRVRRAGPQILRL